jgi:hypothetical protein
MPTLRHDTAIPIASVHLRCPHSLTRCHITNATIQSLHPEERHSLEEPEYQPTPSVHIHLQRVNALDSLLVTWFILSASCGHACAHIGCVRTLLMTAKTWKTTTMHSISTLHRFKLTPGDQPKPLNSLNHNAVTLPPCNCFACTRCTSRITRVQGMQSAQRPTYMQYSIN